MSDALNEILKRLAADHTGGIEYDPDEHDKLRCKWANEAAGSLNEIDGYNCDICKNKGVTYFLKLNEITGFNALTARQCKCMNIRQTLRRARESGLEDVLTDCTFDKYETPEQWQSVIKDKAKAFCADDDAKWFYIGGQTGAGKSHICTAIASHYIKAGLRCRYMLWRDDAVRLKAAVNDGERYEKMIADFKKVDVLYIDDFLKTQEGTEPTAGDINVAFELLNYRILDKNKITIISSEYTITRALEFDEATIGRVYQKAGVYKISIDRDINKNYRLKA